MKSNFTVVHDEELGTSLVYVEDIDDWQGRIILLEEGSKTCAVYYADADEEDAVWIKAQGMMPPEYTGRHVCSRCGKFALSNNWGREELSDHCPACGKKMRSKAE